MTASYRPTAALTESVIRNAWKRTVREGLRNQVLTDVHDHLDIHRNIQSIAHRLENEVASGAYRPLESEVVHLEKKLGVCRRLVLPSGRDALVLQSLIDVIEGAVLAAAPTKSAYYARSHMPSGRIEDLDGSLPYVWWKLWPVFQEKIWEFSQSYDWVVMTDVANYFDAIPLIRLRNRVAATAKLEESVLDLLFFLLDAFVWRPNYMPFSGVGLPQIDFDAPRLLAHAFLYQVDELLNEETGGDVVRWMDDIDFGVESEAQGKRVLGRLDLLLVQHGLRLNLGKTRVLSGRDALRTLWVDENRRLTILGQLYSNAASPARSRGRLAAYTFRKFSNFWRRSRHGSWSKVLLRYITLLRSLEDWRILGYAPAILANEPSARAHMLRVFEEAGYTADRFRTLESFLTGPDCIDDISLFQTCRTIAAWRIPRRSSYVARAVRLGLAVATAHPTVTGAFAGGLWLVAKYGTPADLGSYVQRTMSTWERSEWAARQVAGVAPLLSGADEETVRRVLRRGGFLEAFSVVESLTALGRLSALDSQISGYLKSPGRVYELPRLIAARAVLSGLPEVEATQLEADLDRVIDDQVVRRRIGLTG